MTKIKLDASKVSTVAETASCDVRTVLKAAEGKPVKKMTLHRIQAALAALGLGLVLLVVGCDGGPMEVEAPDAGACQTWHDVTTEGTFLGREVCQDGAPVAPSTQLSGACACPDASSTGYYSSVNGVWYCLCVVPQPAPVPPPPAPVAPPVAIPAPLPAPIPPQAAPVQPPSAPGAPLPAPIPPPAVPPCFDRALGDITACPGRTDCATSSTVTSRTMCQDNGVTYVVSCDECAGGH